MAGRRTLMIVAAPREAEAVLRGLGGDPSGDPSGDPGPDPGPDPDRDLGAAAGSVGFWRPVSTGDADVVLCGIGKANAAAAAARFLDRGRHAGVLSIGVAGSLPCDRPPAIGAALLARPSVFADEGRGEPAGFVACRAMGFPLLGSRAEDAFGPDDAWADALVGLADDAGPVATVSTCSATDELAAETRRRTGAAAEAMEGAAVGLAAARLRDAGGRADPWPRFAELRVISNTTGSAPRWALDGALERLAGLAGDASRALRGIG